MTFLPIYFLKIRNLQKLKDLSNKSLRKPTKRNNSSELKPKRGSASETSMVMAAKTQYPIKRATTPAKELKSKTALGKMNNTGRFQRM